MKNFFKNWRPYIAYGAFFSMFINVLQLTFPIYMLQIYDRVLSSYSMPTLFVLTLAAVICLIVMALLEFTRSRLLVRCGVAIDHALSRTVLDSVIKQSALLGMKPDQATLRDVNLVRNFFGGNAIFTLFDIPWTPLFLAVIYALHPMLGMVATAGAVLLVILAIINEKITRQPLDAANTVNGFSMKYVETARRNARTIRSMGMLEGVASRWSEYNDTVTKLQTQSSRRAGLVQSLSSWLRQSMQVFIYGVGAWLTLEGSSTAGCMIAASIIMGRALAPVQMGIGSWKSMVEARGAWKRLDVLLSQPEEKEQMDLPVPTGSLAVEAVSFAIGQSVILRGINFSLEPGESLGLIGPSGAGKSTLCRLLLGIWPANAGAVRLDGADVFTWDKEKLGPYIGYLPQDIELFPVSIAENIARMGEVDSDAVIEAARQAGVHELILSFPKGYDARIGEGNVVLSGGQRQRIGLARALYAKPKFIILDEPNSNLDDEGERALVASWPLLKAQGTTLVVVSHKPSLLSGVDKILMLKEGQQVMFGPRDAVFKKLMETKGQMQA
ncbi:MAG: type I secretion system permease/ATPase [Desulfuromonadaceae bacterium]|nr:type I secretion system permease/ATPase [Desulfuromonas sp.]MDY0185599.1 type I secretion system permease/ATPase [Desulfuromonadaceae bacterium]